MMINILFFARLREVVGRGSIQYQPSLDKLPTVKTVLEEIKIQFKQLNDEKNISAALNQELLSDWNMPVKDGDEIAFFPPITGG
ncbi:MAG: MoaD/ThiS family protein [Proteobacteria bacterium]|jgi:sulfur-carrier protein|nr:MoaD/ThiS family protein [Pseudomonadota bacterium]